MEVEPREAVVVEYRGGGVFGGGRPAPLVSIILIREEITPPYFLWDFYYSARADGLEAILLHPFFTVKKLLRIRGEITPPYFSWEFSYSIRTVGLAPAPATPVRRSELRGRVVGDAPIIVCICIRTVGLVPAPATSVRRSELRGRVVGGAPINV